MLNKKVFNLNKIIEKMSISKEEWKKYNEINNYNFYFLVYFCFNLILLVYKNIY
jgi:hypothetical protein